MSSYTVRDGMNDMLAGMGHALATTAVGYPFDLIKSRLQTGKYANSILCLKSTFRNEGIRGLYRGGSMPLLSHLLKRPIQYPIAEWMKKEMNTTNSILGNYGIGALNGLTSPLIGTPLQVVKVSMQTSSGSEAGKKNSWSYIKHNFHTNGIMGFYRGFIPTAVKDTVFGTSYIGTYYTLRDFTGTDNWYQSMINGAIAHSTTWFIFMPIDYVKTIVQKSETSLSVFNVIRTTYCTKGLKEFWRGIVPACLRTVPVSALAMFSYESIRSYLK
jgi:hypothetical protein